MSWFFWRGGQDSNLRTGLKPVNRLAGGPNRPLWHLPVSKLFICQAEGEGFEPPETYNASVVFKTTALNHSAIPPGLPFAGRPSEAEASISRTIRVVNGFPL
jgi:hypothetical protein